MPLRPLLQASIFKSQLVSLGNYVTLPFLARILPGSEIVLDSTGDSKLRRLFPSYLSSFPGMPIGVLKARVTVDPD